MNSFNNFILTLFQSGYKMRGTSLAHLLKGKRTSSVLSYGFFFDLLPYFGIWPNFKLKQLKKALAELVEKQLLIRENHFYQLSEAGSDYLFYLKERKFPLKKLKGIQFSNLNQPFWHQLLFTTQVVSEFSYQNTDYYPIETQLAAQNQVKRWLAQVSNKERDWIKAFYEEWLALFLSLPAVVRPVLMEFLSGHDKIGQTLSQVSQSKSWETLDFRLNVLNYQHQLLELILRKQRDFPLFNQLILTLNIHPTNQSMEASYQLLLQNYSLAEIVAIRKLKESTITEHFIEAAILKKSFPYEQLISSQTERALRRYQETKGDIRQWQFQEVKKDLPAIDFYTFRLYQLKQVRLEEND